VSPETAAYVTAELKASDRDRYLASLVLPEPQRQAVAALYAFSADVASVRERAKEPAAGEIRLQWWTDALTGDGHGNVRQNPLADALLRAIADYGLPVPPLARLIAARRFDLYHDPMPDMPTFEGYAGETVSALYQLGAMILNGGRPVETGEAAGHLGVAHALIGHLRAFGYNASQGRLFLPLEVFTICGLAEDEVLSGNPGERVTIALTRLAETAAEHLDKAARAARDLPSSLRPAFAPVALLRMERRALDLDQPYRPPADIAVWRKIAALAWWRLRNGG
jgi:phytoene synthase